MGELTFRNAVEADVPGLVTLLADDELGAQREDRALPLAETYYDAFRLIDGDPAHELIVAEAEGELVGTLQLTVLPGLTYKGSSRAQVEAVRVAREHRGAGTGRRLLEHAIERARQRGCRLVQLTTDKTRPDALRFYESLGFRTSHEGMKLRL